MPEQKYIKLLSITDLHNIKIALQRALDVEAYKEKEKGTVESLVEKLNEFEKLLNQKKDKE